MDKRLEGLIQAVEDQSRFAPGRRWVANSSALEAKWPAQVTLVEHEVTWQGSWVRFDSELGQFRISQGAFTLAYELALPRTRYDFILEDG